MINATIRKRNNTYLSFECKGHSGYAQSGSDIICSAVSFLTTTIFNSIETFTGCKMIQEVEDGYMYIEFIDNTNKEITLLMDTLVLGLKSLEDTYNRSYLTLIIEEV